MGAHQEANHVKGDVMRLMILGLGAALLSSTAHAATFVEVGDAGQTLTTAAVASTGVSSAALSDIFGSLSTAGDADLFRIYISSPSSFSATTNNADTSFDLDTELFLLSGTGTAIAVNDDDASGLVLNSTLPVGNSRYAGLAAGYYYLGISNSGNELVNLNNQLLFASGLGTSARGPASGLNPTTLYNFNEQQYDETLPGAYRINLTGASLGPAVTSGVPEPSTWAMMLAGFGAMGASLRVRRRATRFAMV